MSEQQKVTGGCMCGKVRYEATGAPQYVGYCHCRSCRHHTGAPAVAVVVFKADKVRFAQGDRSVYNSSPGVGRGFCGECGTTLTWEGRDHISLQIGTLDDPDNHVPTLHWFYEERIPWFDVASDLPHLGKADILRFHQ